MSRKPRNSLIKWLYLFVRYAPLVAQMCVLLVPLMDTFTHPCNVVVSYSKEQKLVFVRVSVPAQTVKDGLFFMLSPSFSQRLASSSFCSPVVRFRNPPLGERQS
jgi:hypothetical protein